MEQKANIINCLTVIRTVSEFNVTSDYTSLFLINVKIKVSDKRNWHGRYTENSDTLSILFL